MPMEKDVKRKDFKYISQRAANGQEEYLEMKENSKYKQRQLYMLSIFDL